MFVKSVKNKFKILIDKTPPCIYKMLAVTLLAVILCINFWVSVSYNFFGDCAVHAWISNNIWNKGSLVYQLNYITDSAGTKRLITYPLIFHVSLALSNILGFPMGIYIFMFFYNLFYLLSFYTFTRDLFNNKVAFLSVFVLSCSSQFFTLSTLLFMEHFLFGFILLFLVCLLKFSNSMNFKFLYLAFFFCGVAVSTKQSAIVAMIPIILWISISKRILLKINLPNLFMGITIFFLVVYPVLSYQISTTGTITVPPDGPPSSWIFNKKWHEDPTSISYIQKSMQMENLYNWLVNDTTHKRIFRFFYPFNLNCLHNFSPHMALFLLLLIMGIIFSFKNRKEFLSLLSITSIVYLYFILTATANPRYYLLLFLLIIPLFCSGIFVLREKNKFLTILCVFLLAISSTTLFAENISYKDNPDRPYIYCEYYTQEFRDSFIQGCNYLKSIYSGGVVLTYCHEVMLYSNATVTWINPHGGSEFIEMFNTKNITRIMEILKSYHIRYIFIAKNQIDSGGIKNVPKNFCDIIENEKICNILFRNNLVKIYEVKI